LEEREVATNPETQRLAPFAIYTITHSSGLARAARASSRTIRFTEHSPWQTGARLLEQAREQEQQVAVVFAAAELVEGVTHWGVLQNLVVFKDPAGRPISDVTVAQVRRLPRRHALNELRLKSTGRALADTYIRPYAIIHVPGFLTNRGEVGPRRRPTRG
jgi:hypothetical protein